MRRIAICVGGLWALVAVPTFATEQVTPLGVGLIDYEPLAQDLPFPEATIVVVHPWTFNPATTYLITLDDAPLAVLSVGQYVIWRTPPRDLILGVKSPDSLHLIQALRAEPGGVYYFRTSRRGLDRTSQAEGQALVEVSTPAEVRLE